MEQHRSLKFWLIISVGFLCCSVVLCSQVNRVVAYYYYIGGAVSTASDSEIALEYFDMAIKLDPEMAVAYQGRGRVYAYFAFDREKAIADFTKAIELDKSGESAYYERGLAYHRAGKSEQAIADFTKAMAIDPIFTDIYGLRGFTYAETGDLEQAIAEFEHYLKLGPQALNREEVMAAVAKLKAKVAR